MATQQNHLHVLNREPQLTNRTSTRWLCTTVPQQLSASPQIHQQRRFGHGPLDIPTLPRKKQQMSPHFHRIQSQSNIIPRPRSTNSLHATTTCTEQRRSPTNIPQTTNPRRLGSSNSSLHSRSRGRRSTNGFQRRYNGATPFELPCTNKPPRRPPR